jgi:hypothetical protein
VVSCLQLRWFDKQLVQTGAIPASARALVGDTEVGIVVPASTQLEVNMRASSTSAANLP